VFGLLPPSAHGGKYKALQKQLWAFWERVTGQEYDIAILNGDLIDGGIDIQYHVTMDRSEQVQLAEEAMRAVQAKKVYITLGTPLHTGGEGVFERLLPGDVKEEHRLKIEGLNVHVRHKVPVSKTGYGQETLLARDALAQVVADSHLLVGDRPRLVVRGHAHRYVRTNNEIVDGLIVPCLQYPYSWYGATISRWQYAMGVCVMIVDGEAYTVEPHLISLVGGWLRYAKV
jgi:hypothetical protein